MGLKIIYTINKMGTSIFFTNMILFGLNFGYFISNYPVYV